MLRIDFSQEDLVSQFPLENTQWIISSLQKSEKNNLLKKISPSVLQNHYQWIFSFQPELLTDDIINKINSRSAQLELYTKIKSLQDEKFFSWLFALQPEWLTNDIIARINASIQYIKITNIIIHSYENLYTLLALLEQFAKLEKSAESNRQTANTFKIITDESPIHFDFFLDLKLENPETPQPLTVDDLQHIRLVHPDAGLLSTTTPDHVYLYKELQDPNNPGLLNKDPINRRDLTVADIRNVEETDIDLNFANRLIKIKHLLMNQQEFDQYSYNLPTRPVMDILKINDEEKIVLEQELNYVLILKKEIVATFKKNLTEYKDKRLYIDRNGELKPKVFTNPDRVIAYKALQAQVQKSNSMLSLLKVINEQARNIDLDNQEHVRTGLQYYCKQFNYFYEQFTIEIKKIINKVGNDIRQNKLTNFYFLASPDIYNELPEKLKIELFNKCPQIMRVLCAEQNRLGNEESLNLNEHILEQLHANPRSYMQLIEDIDFLKYILEQANQHPLENERRKINHLLCNIIFEVTTQPNLLYKLVNNLAKIPNASIKYLSFYWQVPPQQCIGKMDLTTIITAASTFHLQKTKIDKGKEQDDPQHQLTDLDLTAGLEWIASQIQKPSAPSANLLSEHPLIEFFIPLQIDHANPDYNLTAFANKIKNDISKPRCYLGIYSIDNNHYVPYCIFKNSEGKINVITVDPAYAGTSKFKSKLATELAFKTLFPDCSFEDPFITQQFNGYDCGINSLQTIYEICQSLLNPSPTSVVSIDGNNNLLIHAEYLSMNSNKKEFIDARDKFKIQCVENRLTWENRLIDINNLNTSGCSYSYHDSKLEQTRNDQKELYQNRIIGEFLNHSLFITCLEQWRVNNGLSLEQAEPHLNSFLEKNDYGVLYKKCEFDEKELNNKLLIIINQFLPNEYGKFCKGNKRLIAKLRHTGEIPVELNNKLNTIDTDHEMVKIFIEKQLKAEAEAVARKKNNLAKRVAVQSKLVIQPKAPSSPSSPIIPTVLTKKPPPKTMPSTHSSLIQLPVATIFSDESQSEFVRKNWLQLTLSGGTIGAASGGIAGSVFAPVTFGLSWPIFVSIGFALGGFISLAGLAFGMGLESIHKYYLKKNNSLETILTSPTSNTKISVQPSIAYTKKPTKQTIAVPRMINSSPNLRAAAKVKLSEVKSTLCHSFSGLKSGTEKETNYFKDYQPRKKGPQ